MIFAAILLCVTRSFFNLCNIPGLCHAITTREGGVSGGPYESLNLGFHVGDNADDVRENRKRLAQTLGFDAKRLVCAQQTHGASSHAVGVADLGHGARDWDSAIPDCDALIVAERSIPAMILVADCAPILVVEPRARVFALIHAGWRGAVAGVLGKTLARMRDEFGADINHARVRVGPCLCVKCFEIGTEVAAQVRAATRSESLRDYAIRPSTLEGKAHFDIRTFLAFEAQTYKVSASAIKASGICPRCSNDEYFSHRGQGGVAGRFGLVAWWE